LSSDCDEGATPEVEAAGGDAEVTPTARKVGTRIGNTRMIEDNRKSDQIPQQQSNFTYPHCRWKVEGKGRGRNPLGGAQSI
jgi:hypothetical protein